MDVGEGGLWGRFGVDSAKAMVACFARDMWPETGRHGPEVRNGASARGELSERKPGGYKKWGGGSSVVERFVAVVSW